MKHRPSSHPSHCCVNHPRVMAKSILARCCRQSPRLSALRAIATQSDVQTNSSKLQQMYQQALTSFGNGQQPQGPSELLAVSEALRAVPLQELGLQAENRGMFEAWPPFLSRASAITYIHIFEDKNMSIGIFCLPRNATIPLHNHPEMVVLSRVLYGQLHVKSYDWANTQQDNNRQRHTPSAAHMVMDEVIEAGSEPAVIFPTAGGNIHQFTAVTDCAVLDILAPPYSSQGGRDCTYYKAVNVEPDGSVHLVESNPSPPLNMQNKTYKGVQIQPANTACQNC